MIRQNSLLCKIFLWVTVLLSTSTLFFSTPLPAFAGNPITDAITGIQEFIFGPKPKSAPTGKQKAGGGRGEQCLVNPAIPLTAIAPVLRTSLNRDQNEKSQPVYVGGYTTLDYPTLWFYVPYAPSQGKGFAKLMLLDENKTPLFEKAIQFSLEGTPGIVGISLPQQDVAGKQILPLQVEKSYSWYFSVVCNPDRPSKNPSINGWIERISANSNGKDAVWYDTLDSVIREHSSNELGTQRDWESFLKAIMLPELASPAIKIVRCCTPNSAQFNQPF